MKYQPYGWLRKLLDLVASLLVLPTWLFYIAQVNLFGGVYACLFASQHAAQWPGMIGIFMRRALFRHILGQLGENVSIGMGAILTKPTIALGNAVYIGSYSIIGDACIGDHSLISDHVSIVSGNHGLALDTLIKDQPESYHTIRIGKDCWVGSRSVVMADLGNHCVVGAGSVVTKPVADYLIVAGNPAKPIGDRRQEKDSASYRKDDL